MDLRIETGVSLPREGALRAGVSVWLPTHPARAPAVLVCLPGGHMTRRYFDLRPRSEAGGGDLRPDDGDASFSFAAQMTARGFIVVALDYLGVGDSDRPADGYALTPELLTRANEAVTEAVLARLREDRLAPLPSIGVGHSMGAMMTILQQAETRRHAALALLGFSTRGLPEYAPADVRELDGAAVRARLVELARRMFGEPYPALRSSGNGAELYGSAAAEPRGIAALKRVTGALLPVPAFLSLLPGNVAVEAARIEAPVFLGLGERDMAGPPQEVPAAFPRSRAVTLYIQPQAGHSHFLFPTRSELFERFAAWARSVVGKGKETETTTWRH